MWKDALWLKVPHTEIVEKQIYHGDMTGRFAYFRCEADLPSDAALTVDITANSRYRLWVNGNPVLSGPAKGDLHRQYYDTVDLTKYLTAGRNCFCVQVLYCDPDTAEVQTDQRASLYGVISPRAGHRLALEGDIVNKDGEVVGTITTGKADWCVWLDNSFYLKSSDITCYLGAVMEEIHFDRSPADWKTVGYNCAHWHQAEAASTVHWREPLFYAGVLPKFNIAERSIPLLYEKEDRFVRVFFQQTGENITLLEEGSFSISPGKSLELILDAGVIKNGFPRWTFSRGTGAKVSFTYFEKFGGAESDLCRSDARGTISGLTDTIWLHGGKLVYEPFWFRTFRFVRVRIEPAEESVQMFAPAFRKTGYPLEVTSSVHSSADWVERLWDISVRTLENCMMDTYMDCPYYEQLQFVMDTRLEALYTYAVSGDHALVKKALLDFHCGLLPNGLLPGKYPSAYCQIISTFSLYYIDMLWEYYHQTGDMEMVKLCRADVDRILEYYDGRTGSNGLVGRLDYWEFVDWQDAWSKTSGAPAALQHGPSTIINLMYAYALSRAALLAKATGRSGLADEYLTRHTAIISAVQNTCWDAERGMYREGPDFSQFTQHAQAWAILNDMLTGEPARRILRTAMGSPD